MKLPVPALLTRNPKLFASVTKITGRQCPCMHTSGSETSSPLREEIVCVSHLISITPWKKLTRWWTHFPSRPGGLSLRVYRAIIVRLFVRDVLNVYAKLASAVGIIGLLGVFCIGKLQGFQRSAGSRWGLLVHALAGTVIANREHRTRRV